MKKTFLFTCLMLLTLNFVGCRKSISTDLGLLELSGNVKSVTTRYTTNVTSKGKKTRYSWSYDGAKYYFDEKGLISSIEESETKVNITRDKKGQVVSIDIPCESEEGWNDGGYTKTYTWDKNGRLINEEYSNCIGVYHNRTFIYNDSIIVGTVEQNCDEGIEWEVTRTYKVLATDSEGNWTKRLVVESNSENADIRFSLEERTLTYYDNAISPASSQTTRKDENEWIYGTWECKTQYGTMRLIINDDGRMYDSVEERWCSYSIEGDEIVEHILDGLVSTYHIDRVNKRFDCGNNKDWFRKVSN